MSRASKYALEHLIDGVVAGDRGALARCMRLVDESPERGMSIATRLKDYAGKARVIGVTGNPGAGKSTVVDQLVNVFRNEGQRVAVLAIDPTSPFSGGAILGDRIRMMRHFSDDDVYIRSLATRGTLGGLSRSAFDSVRVLDAAGFDVVVIETVGVGQDEVDVVRLADTTVVVLVPGLGDDVQAMKAGLLEIADIFLINKADREGVNDVQRALKQMLSLVSTTAGWEPPIVQSIATTGEGIPELCKKLERHHDFLQQGEGRRRLEQRRVALMMRLFDHAMVAHGRSQLASALSAARKQVRHGKDPYQAVSDLLELLP